MLSVTLHCVPCLPSATGQGCDRDHSSVGFAMVVGSTLLFSCGFLDLCCPQPTAFCGSRPVQKCLLGAELHADNVD